MATDRMALLELLGKAASDGDTDLLREGVKMLARALMEAEVSAQVGLGRRCDDRTSVPIR